MNMNIGRIIAGLLTSVALVTVATAAPPPGKGGGKGGNDGGGGTPVEFVPAIAFEVETNKYNDIRISNVEGNQSCLVLRVNKDNAAGRLRAFSFSAKTKQLAYSLEGDVYIATWDTDPCIIQTSPTPAVQGLPVYDNQNLIDDIEFSPDGSQLVWPLNPETDDGTRDIVFYNLDSAGPPNRVNTDYFLFDAKFSPEFGRSNEVFFMGYQVPVPGYGPFSLFGYNQLTGSVRQVINGSGSGLDSQISVSNEDSSSFVRIAVRDNDSGFIQQHNALGYLSEPLIVGTDRGVAYGCDNSKILFAVAVNWRNTDIYLSARDGSSAQLWSSSDLRDIEWLCE
jgi:hypothetical protein